MPHGNLQTLSAFLSKPPKQTTVLPVPELPEVEVLVRHLRPWLKNKTIGDVSVYRARVLSPTTVRTFKKKLRGASFRGVSRRGKYLLFEIRCLGERRTQVLLGHLGMTGRMYLLPANHPLPKHAAVVMNLGRNKFVFEDTRYFGRLTFDLRPIRRLGAEPFDEEFTPEKFLEVLKHSRQPIKVRLLAQSIVAGLGNIYVSEALFHAKLSPRIPARRLTAAQATGLWHAIRQVLSEAIQRGITIPLDYAGLGSKDGLFYFGREPGVIGSYEERLCVYARAGQPCVNCHTAIKRLIQVGRSTFYCPSCQRGNRGKKQFDAV